MTRPLMKHLTSSSSTPRSRRQVASNSRFQAHDATRNQISLWFHTKAWENLSDCLWKRPNVEQNLGYLVAQSATERPRDELMRSPTISGAQTYLELCLTAKNEEKWLLCLSNDLPVGSVSLRGSNCPVSCLLREREPIFCSDCTEHPLVPQLNPAW